MVLFHVNAGDGSALDIRHIGLLVIEAVDGQLGSGELGQALLNADVQGLLGKEILVRGVENDLALVAALDLVRVLPGVVRGDQPQGPVVHDLQIEEVVHIVVGDDVIILILGAKLGRLDQMAQGLDGLDGLVVLIGIIGIHGVGIIGIGAGLIAQLGMDPQLEAAGLVELQGGVGADESHIRQLLGLFVHHCHEALDTAAYMLGDGYRRVIAGA